MRFTLPASICYDVALLGTCRNISALGGHSVLSSCYRDALAIGSRKKIIAIDRCHVMGTFYDAARLIITLISDIQIDGCGVVTC